MRLFSADIFSYDDWARVYQSIPHFAPLIAHAFARNGLPFNQADIKNLTPGTNAVFQVGDYVIKIFAPVMSGFDGEKDYAVELAVHEHLQRLGVIAPKLFAKGLIQDTYRFPYMIMEKVDGTEIRNLQQNFSSMQIQLFAKQMRLICETINQPTKVIPAIDLIDQARNNERLDRIPSALKADFLSRLSHVEESEKVLVHGDITGENVMLDRNGNIVLIDFADACLAPAYYELVPIVFDLFHCNKAYIDAFKGEQSISSFCRDLLQGLVIHDFAADIICDFCHRFSLPLHQMRTLDDIIKAFYNIYRFGDRWTP